MKLDSKFFEKNKTDFEKCRGNRVAQRAAGNVGVTKAAFSVFEDDTNRHAFNVELKETKIRNQKQSGRCWMFAAMNVLEYTLCQKYNIKEFELSQNYTLFYDKLERSNYFLNSIVDTFDEKLESRVVAHLLSDPMGDGGQWDMIKNIINKYGVVPKYAMPETENSSHTADMNTNLTKLLRIAAKDLRNAHAEGKSENEIEEIISNTMDNVYKILSISLGTPPEKIDFETRDADNHFISYKNITPKEFFNTHIGLDLDNYISIINAPTKDKPFYKSYTVKYLGNVLEGDIVKHVNVKIEDMKKAIVDQLRDNEPVWFGCDVGQNFFRGGSRLDLQSIRYDELFGVNFDFSKEDELDYKESLMTHAMVFMGCDYDESTNKVNRYKVENSWGEDAGHKGYLVMSDEWFDKYMYQALINKKHLSKEILDAYEEQPKELEPWDPMGSLA